MSTENYIRLLGVIVGIGILDSYDTLNNGIAFIGLGHISSFLIGLAEVFRWSFGLLAAILLLRVQSLAKWALLFAFLCGLIATWVSFIPFAGYLMRFADQSSGLQIFIILQVPNLALVLIVFYLFKKLKKYNSKIQPTIGVSVE